jgi:hypothetical protein
MNLETEVLAQRIEALERQARIWKLLGALAILLAVAAIAVRFLEIGPAASPPAPVTGGVGRFSSVEANRILLRDSGGQVAGGLEVTPDSTIKLVLGGRYGTRGAAFLEVHGNGAVALTLRGPDSGVRAALLGTATPSLTLSPDGGRSSAALLTTPQGAGMIQLTDPAGRMRFRAP